MVFTKMGKAAVMDKQLKKDINWAIVFSLVIGVVLLFFQPSLAFGLWLGLIVAIGNTTITNRYIDHLFFEEKFTIFTFGLYILSNYGLYILAFFTSVWVSWLFNIYMVALGLVMIKCTIYVRHFLMFKKGAKTNE